MYFSSNRGGEPQIWKMPAQGGDAVQMTRKGGSGAMESPDGRYLYYLKTGAGKKDSLWRLRLEGGDEAQVLESVLNNQYAASDRGIYFIPDSKPFSVRFLNFDTGEVTIIANIPREPVWGLSVSPDGRSLLYSEFEATRSDLMLVENFR
jgi:Tol biopolymer transport system component